MKKVFYTLLAVGSGVFALGKSVRRSRSAATPARELDTSEATRNYMMYVLLPFWFVPGVLDWWWHRQTSIETTSGTQESLIHALMMTEVGLPILMGLLLEINAGVFGLMIGAAVLHEATAFWDVSFAVERRKVLPREQHTHSLLEVIPLAALSFAACLHPRQFVALFGASGEKADLGSRLKEPALPGRYLASILGAIAVFIAAPYAEELTRCWIAQRKGLVGRDTPECAPVLFG